MKPATQKTRAADKIEDVPLSFESPESSSITRATYDPPSRHLTVWFKRKDGEDAYDHINVPEKVWAEFEAAPSKGRFYSYIIGPLFLGTRRLI